MYPIILVIFTFFAVISYFCSCLCLILSKNVSR